MTLSGTESAAQMEQQISLYSSSHRDTRPATTRVTAPGDTSGHHACATALVHVQLAHAETLALHPSEPSAEFNCSWLSMDTRNSFTCVNSPDMQVSRACGQRPVPALCIPLDQHTQNSSSNTLRLRAMHRSAAALPRP